MLADNSVHTFFHAAYQVLLAREIEAALRSEVQFWNTEPDAMVTFLARVLASDEFKSRPEPTRQAAAFLIWLDEWSRSQTPEYAQSLLQKIFAILPDPKLSVLGCVTFKDTDGTNLLISLPFSTDPDEVLLLNCDPQRAARLIGAGGLPVVLKPHGCAVVQLRDFSPDLLCEMESDGAAEPTRFSLRTAEPELASTAPSPVAQIALGEWLEDNELRFLLSKTFGAEYRGIHSDKFLQGEASLLWDRHLQEAGKILPPSPIITCFPTTS